MRNDGRSLHGWQLGLVLVGVVALRILLAGALEARELEGQLLDPEIIPDEPAAEERIALPEQIYPTTHVPRTEPTPTPSTQVEKSTQLSAPPQYVGPSAPSEQTSSCTHLPLTTTSTFSYELANLSQGRFGWHAQSFSQNIELDEQRFLSFQYRVEAPELLPGFAEPVLSVWLDEWPVYEVWLDNLNLEGGWQLAEIDLVDFPSGTYQLSISGGQTFDNFGTTKIEICGLSLGPPKRVPPLAVPTIDSLRAHQLAEKPGEITLSWQLLSPNSQPASLPPGWSYDWRVSSHLVSSATSDQEWRQLPKPALINRPGLGLIGAPSTNRSNPHLASFKLPPTLQDREIFLHLRLNHISGFGQSEISSLKISNPHFFPPTM